MRSSGFTRVGCLSYHSTAWRFRWLGWVAGWSWCTGGDKESKQSPETVKNRWRQTCSGSKTGSSFKASWWCGVHAGYLVTGVFFFFSFAYLDKSAAEIMVFVSFIFFPADGQWYTSAGRDTPTAGSTGRMPWWPAGILSPSAFLQMALKAGWLYFFPEETKTHPDPPLEINAFPKDFIRIFFGRGGGSGPFSKSQLNLWHCFCFIFLAFWQ